MRTIEADVRLHNRHVGTLRYSRGRAEFAYEADLLDPGHRILGQTFEDDPRRVRRAQVGVPDWFANLLPEGALRRQIVRELGGGNIGDFTLLTRLGDYLPGDVSVHADSTPEDDLILDPPEPPDHQIRHSLAGFQLKLSLRGDRLSIPASGATGWWIVKLPDPSLRELVANEYITMRWLAASGFAVPRVELMPAHAVGGIPSGLADREEQVYVIERFDRTASGRIHVEDFAQVADVGPRFKYSESGVTYDGLGRVIRQLTGEVGYADYVRRLTAMLVTGNTDAHLKNWALCYLDGRTPSLAPVYDFHSLTVYQQYRHSALALSINSERIASAVSVEDFRRLADYCGADPDLTVDLVSSTVQTLRESWHNELRAEALSRFDALAEHYSTRLNHLTICTAT
jgi:serine/threonine-protein kinase HipA